MKPQIKTFAAVVVACTAIAGGVALAQSTGTTGNSPSVSPGGAANPPGTQGTGMQGSGTQNTQGSQGTPGTNSTGTVNPSSTTGSTNSGSGTMNNSGSSGTMSDGTTSRSGLNADGSRRARQDRN